MSTQDELRIWHPEVHTRFRESLYYCFCRVRPYIRETFQQALAQRLADLKVTGYCAYEIYGDFDILLRVWLPIDCEDGFEHSLTKGHDELRHVVFFKVTSIRHYWPWPQAATTVDGIGRLSTSLVERVQKADAAAVSEAETAGLLRREHRTERMIKCFVALSDPRLVETSGENRLLRDIEQILSARSENVLARRSVYEGFGAAWVLIKGEVCPEHYFEIRSLVNELSEALGSYGSFTTTYLVTGGAVTENDEISPSSLREMRGRDIEVDALLPELYVLEIDPSLQQQMQTWVRQYVLPWDIDTEERRCIRLLLAGIIGSRPEESESALFAWFRSTEAFLAREWQRFAGKHVGQKEPGEVIKQSGISKEKNGRPFTLGDLVKIARYLLDSAGMGGQVSWPENIEALAELRNKVVHGRFEWRRWSEELSILPEWMAALRKVRDSMRANGAATANGALGASATASEAEDMVRG